MLKNNEDIKKCLFVVDRKDLDRQTREEFNKFQEGSVEENTNTETLVRRLLSTDYADKVIVTTIQKLGLALDGNQKKNYKERLKPLIDQRLVFIFDECHRSQFGDNHKAIKEFFPKAQLFGFTGTPIFEDNASYINREDETASYKTTEDIFEKQLHAYTITHAIDDGNVLRFHIDYYKGEGKQKPKPNEPIAKQAVVKTILEKHNDATNSRKFNAIFATASISDAIEYFNLFKTIQKKKQEEDEHYIPLNIACVFSPPTIAAKDEDKQNQKNINDIKQLQEDLHQEMLDNQTEPEEKKKALTAIIEDYNAQYGTNHSINEFDWYYQDIQKRIKDQQYSNQDYPHRNKIDIVIVVDMLLTGFDSKYLNTLYVDKNLKYHGLIQAFSRTNRILNDTKPYGNILDFRSQQENVNTAIARFSGEDDKNKAKEIWLVEPASKVIEKYQKAITELDNFMKGQNLPTTPEEVYNLKGDTARVTFIKTFKEIQRLKTQLDQYTDLDEAQKQQIETLLPKDTLLEFRSSYMETAKKLKTKQGKAEDTSPELEELDFEFILFASAIIDYDYIMNLVAESTQANPTKQKMTKEQVIRLLSANSNMPNEKEDLTEFIQALDWSRGYTADDLKQRFEDFVTEKKNKTLVAIAQKHHLPIADLKAFVERVIERKIFDGEELTDLLAPLGLGWKERGRKELALMQDLIPELKKLAGEDNEISGLKAYEQN